MKQAKCLFLFTLLIAALQAAAQQVPVKRGAPLTGTYRITQALDTEYRLFKTGDILEVSLKNGLRQLFKNRMLVYGSRKFRGCRFIDAVSA